MEILVPVDKSSNQQEKKRGQADFEPHRIVPVLDKNGAGLAEASTANLYPR
jgi:hypothetical protein